MKRTPDYNCLSYWHPRLYAANIPTPLTQLIALSGDESNSLVRALDGDRPPALLKVAGFVRDSGQRFGWPLFLRTGQGAGKHEWERTCCVADRRNVQRHIAALVEWSHLATIVGLPHDVWVCRSMLLTSPLFRCRRYGNMPVVREWRFFIEGGAVVCSHPYWPTDSLEEGEPDMADWRSCLGGLQGRAPADAFRLAKYAARAFADTGEAWSVDVLEARHDYYVIDMALAVDSFHWPECSRNCWSGGLPG